MSGPADDQCDVMEGVLLRMIVNSGKRVGENFPAVAIRPAFETLRFPRPFADVLASLSAKGLVGGDGEVIHLTGAGLVRAQR